MMTTTVPEVRDLHFDVGERVPRYWNGGRKSVSIFLNNLSVTFPLGERFFIQSVKAHRDLLKDQPKLAAEARAFYAQEGIHSREHERYNDMLRRQGYPVDAMEQSFGQLLDFAKESLTARQQLAATCALEHVTAMVADCLLGDPDALRGADPVMAQLWLWHAAEETEHKAVAFDVFKAVGGSYWERTTGLLRASAIFWHRAFVQQVQMMRHDKLLNSVPEWFALARYLVRHLPKMLPLSRQFLSYLRPSFHPWDHDNKALLDAWKAQLARQPQYDTVRAGTTQLCSSST